MAEPVRAQRLSDGEGRRLQQIVRRGKRGPIRVRRAMIVMRRCRGRWSGRSPGWWPPVRTPCGTWSACSVRKAWRRWALGRRAAVPAWSARVAWRSSAGRGSWA